MYFKYVFMDSYPAIINQEEKSMILLSSYEEVLESQSWYLITTGIVFRSASSNDDTRVLKCELLAPYDLILELDPLGYAFNEHGILAYHTSNEVTHIFPGTPIIKLVFNKLPVEVVDFPKTFLVDEILNGFKEENVNGTN